jgi:hypothetical protein
LAKTAFEVVESANKQATHKYPALCFALENLWNAAWAVVKKRTTLALVGGQSSVIQNSDGIRLWMKIVNFAGNRWIDAEFHSHFLAPYPDTPVVEVLRGPRNQVRTRRTAWLATIPMEIWTALEHAGVTLE